MLDDASTKVCINRVDGFSTNAHSLAWIFAKAVIKLTSEGFSAAGNQEFCQLVLMLHLRIPRELIQEALQCSTCTIVGAFVGRQGDPLFTLCAVPMIMETIFVNNY